MGFCDGMMFCFRRCGKKGGNFFRSQPKERTSCIVKYVLNKLVQNGWMVKLYHRENDGFCCFGNPSREWKACKFEIKRNISVKISAKLIRNFKKKLMTKSTPKSLAILFLFWVWKTPDFVEAFNHSTFLVGNFPAKKLQVVTVKRPKTLVDFRMNYFLQESLNYPFLGESNNTKVYGNFEDFPSNNALGWVGKSTRIFVL